MTDERSTSDSEPTADELREQAERAREELGRTAEGLAAKAEATKNDVKERAEETKARVQHKAAEVQEKATATLRLAQDKAPDQWNEQATRLTRAVRRNPAPFIAAAAVLVALSVRRARTRH